MLALLSRQRDVLSLNVLVSILVHLSNVRALRWKQYRVLSTSALLRRQLLEQIER